jgi:hypothetical protein
MSARPAWISPKGIGLANPFFGILFCAEDTVMAIGMNCSFAKRNEINVCSQNATQNKILVKGEW